jgi:hypothetical protein
MQKFIVSMLNSEDGTDFRIVEAKSKEAALAIYRFFVFPKNEDFLWYLAEKSVNTGFVERFWMETAEEMTAFHSRGAVVVSYELFAQRVSNAFEDQRELAQNYIDYHLDPSETNIDDLPAGLADYIALNHGQDWAELLVVPLSSIPILEMTAHH